MRIVVVGGGASGLCAAIFAARNGAKVTIIEHKDRVGKKLLMTGNGKCNLTNMSGFEGKYYSSDDKSLEMIYTALGRFDATDTRNFFKSLGLYTKEMRDGGVYPVSEQAAVVLDVLRSECERLGVRIITDCVIKSVSRGVLDTAVLGGDKNDKIKYDKIILATGGKAAKVSGSDGSGYELAKSFGHSIITPLPALVQLKCAGDYFKGVAGVRAKVEIKLYVNNKLTAKQEGELQLTDYGISGIPVFQISRIVARALHDGKKCHVTVNFLPYISDIGAEIENMNIASYTHKTVEEILAGLVNKKLAVMICRKNNISPSAKVGNANIGKIEDCVRELSEFKIPVTGTNTFDNAQVSCGGVPLCEVDSDFRSLKDESLYIVGELLDCDGVCGGYNLQWAWTTGAIAGSAAAN